ncbi:cupin domain-containing protein [Streptomyces sp. NPDC003035]|uniref:cupin domain-containing protein n=1 Tax=Streptomyces sp. NPDC003035 TaxID=3364676 RepID=UPI00369A4BEC
MADELDAPVGGEASRTSELVARLGLEPHVEGGWFRRTWVTEPQAVPDGYAETRPFATGIYFLLHPGEVSRWHRVRAEELWLWHRGGPLILRLGGNGNAPEVTDVLVLGPEVEHGEQPQVRVPAGVWQTAETKGAEPVLVSCVVVPGFDFQDFEML